MAEGERVIIDEERFLAAEVDGDVFLVERATGTSYRIGGSGGRFWNLLRAGVPLDEASATVGEETNAEPAVVRRDLTGFVAELEKIGAARRIADPSV